MLKGCRHAGGTWPHMFGHLRSIERMQDYFIWIFQDTRIFYLDNNGVVQLAMLVKAIKKDFPRLETIKQVRGDKLYNCIQKMLLFRPEHTSSMLGEQQSSRSGVQEKTCARGM